MVRQTQSLEYMKGRQNLVAGAADIGGTNTRVGLIRDDGTIIRVSRFKTPVSGKPEDIPQTIARILRDMAAREDSICLAGIGVAAAGPINIKTGILNHPPNIPFETVPIVKPLIELTGLPVVFRNDCRAAVLGEVLVGGGKGCKNVVYITISTGIGAGVFTGGQVLSGRGGNAAEIGHFPVDTSYSFPCTCGLVGHWEGYASGKGIPVFFREWCGKHNYKDYALNHAKDILNLSSEGDDVGRKFRTAIALINGRGLSAVIVAYDPDCIILDGAVIRNHPDLLVEAMQFTDRYLNLPEFRISPLEGNAPFIGAAMAVFHTDMI